MLKSEIEIEFKSKLTSEEYEILLYKYQSEGMLSSQTNYYFDTKKLFYNKHNITIRIREKNDTFVITKKIPNNTSNLEESINITKEQALDYIKKGMNKEIFDFVDNLDYYTKLKTNRFAFRYHGGIVCLDISSYSNKIDFELEFEADELVHKKDFFSFLYENKIKYRPINSKRERAFIEVQSYESI